MRDFKNVKVILLRELMDLAGGVAFAFKTPG